MTLYYRHSNTTSVILATLWCLLLLSCSFSQAFTMPCSIQSYHSRTPVSQSSLQIDNKFKRRYQSTTSLQAKVAPKGFELWNLFYDDLDLATSAWDWTANIGAPAALVAGAVLVTLSETREETAPRKHDFWWVRKAKMTMRFLLLSSFALEVISIFVSTMTGSVLLGHGPAKQAVGYTSALQLLHHHHE